MSIAELDDDTPLPTVVDEPRPCFKKGRVYSGGPYIPGHIFAGPCTCHANGPEPHSWSDGSAGRPCDEFYSLRVQVMHFPPSKHESAIRSVWNYWREISEDEYLALMTEGAWNGDSAEAGDD